jgi:glycosyltransferase involved in cell wall biosynthesis
MDESNAKAPVAYVVSRYPAASETFVYREVDALKKRGWPIHTATLYQPQSQPPDQDPADFVVYADPRLKGLFAWFLASMRRPVRTARILAIALQDAVWPGERMKLLSRAKLLIQALAGAGLSKELAKCGVRHIHCHFAHAPASVGMYAALHANISFSFTGHANDLFERRALLKRKLERASFVACISRWHRRFFASIDPDVEKRCRIVRCGVDLDHWRRDQAPVTTNGTFRMLTVARLVPKKGIDTLLRALSTLQSNGQSGWQLDIIGDGPERDRLEDLSQALRLSQRVTFHGQADNATVQNWMSQADGFVLPCQADPRGDRDGIPVVLMEAMAQGVPVVAGDVTAVRELIDDRQNGLLVKPADEQHLAEVLSSLLNNKSFRQRLAVEGRNAVEKEFGLTANAERLEQALEFCVEHTPRNATSSPSPSMAQSRRYCLISPCRDEARYMRRTLDSVVNQTVRPTMWVVVDDGSTDGSSEILAEYAEQYEFIHVVRREDRGRRSVGPGVVDAFYAGYETIDPSQYDYICKLDLDLDLPSRYFERLMELMEADKQLGTCSGKPYFRDSGKIVLEKCGDEMSVGMTKFYRVSCFKQIGGFVRQVMWDGIDCHRCRMLGWKAGSIDEPDLRFEHLRPMGASDKGILRGRMRHGYGQYFMGTSFIYMTASALVRLTTKPRVIGALAMWWGYVQSWLSGKPRMNDPAFRAFLRHYQRRCLLKGKRRATEEVENNSALCNNWVNQHPLGEIEDQDPASLRKEASKGTSLKLGQD